VLLHLSLSILFCVLEPKQCVKSYEIIFRKCQDNCFYFSETMSNCLYRRSSDISGEMFRKIFSLYANISSLHKGCTNTANHLNVLVVCKLFRVQTDDVYYY